MYLQYSLKKNCIYLRSFGFSIMFILRTLLYVFFLFYNSYTYARCTYICNVLLGRSGRRLKIRASFTIALIVYPVHKLVIIHCKTIFIFIASLFSSVQQNANYNIGT